MTKPFACLLPAIFCGLLCCAVPPALECDTGTLSITDAHRQASKATPQKATDFHGDPLPPGTIARMGTIRFRTGSRVWPPQLTFSPDARIVASNAEPGLITLWEAGSGKLLHRLTTLDDFESEVKRTGSTPSWSYDKPAFSTDGKTLACGGMYWNVDDGKRAKPELAKGLSFLKEKVELPQDFSRLAVSADGKFTAGVRGHGTIFVKDAATGKETCRLEGHECSLAGVAFSPGGLILATTDEKGALRLWEACSGKPISSAALDRQLKDVAFSPDGTVLAVPVMGLGNLDQLVGQAMMPLWIRRWDPIRLKELHAWKTVEASVFGHPMVYAPDGKTIAFGASDGAIAIWSTAGQEHVRIADGQMRYCESLAYSPDSKLLAAASIAGVIIYDTASGKVVKEMPRQWPAMTSVAFSPDGKVLAGGSLAQIHLWDCTTGKQLAVFGDHQARIAGLAFSPDGKILASAGWDGGGIRLWDVAQGKLVHRFTGHSRSIMAIAFSPDGKSLASAGSDCTALNWDVSNFVAPEPPHEISGADLEACWTDLSADGPAPYRAVRRLVASPGPAVAFLAGRLQPAAKVEPQHIAQLIANLGSEQYKLRQKATKDLSDLGPIAANAIDKALAEKMPLEVLQRLRAIREQSENGALPPEILRQIRAVETLEAIGTAAAQQLLETLSKGAEEAWQTKEARASLLRLAWQRDHLLPR
jgi:WD40 repeat protein